MKISVRLDRDVYGPTGGRRHAWLRIEAPRRSGPSQRPPLDLSLVLDRSGSMAGDKITLAKRAAGQAAASLRETDRCALVSYDEHIVVETPARGVDAGQRDLLRAALARLDARGSTDLFGGWLAGAEQIRETSPGRVSRVLILTDGLANVGVTDPQEIARHVRELCARGIGTSTFGVGRDFDEFLLAQMAEAGNGHFYFIQQPAQIPDFLASELGELLTVAARRVEVQVRIGGLPGVTCINDLPLQDGWWQLGDLSETAVIDLLFAIDLPAAAPETLELSLALRWADPEGEAPRTSGETLLLRRMTDAEAEAAALDRETIERVVKARGARVHFDALRLNRSGDYIAAKAAVDREIAGLEALAKDCPEARDEVARLKETAGEFAGMMDAMAMKQRHFAAYSTMRSRPPQKGQQ